MASPSEQPSSPLARQARELFVVHVGRALPELEKAFESKLRGLLDVAGTPAQNMQRRDAWMAFQKQRGAWLNNTRKLLQRTLLPVSGGGATVASGFDQLPGRQEFSLVEDGVVNDQIIASRLAMAVLDKSSTEINELRLRIQHLDRTTELARNDILLPEVVARLLVEQWVASGQTREAWAMAQDMVAPVMAEKMLEAYKATNAFLINSGVMKEIDLQALVKRAPPGRDEGRRRSGASGVGSGFGGGRPTGSGADTGGMFSRSGPSSSGMGIGEETRLLTGVTPLARARMRAQGVVGRLKRLLLDRVGDDFEATQALPPSPQLQQAMSRVSVSVRGAPYYASGTAALRADSGQVQRVAQSLRERADELKRAADTPTEKATVEVVALMFQSILAEERIPAAVRVWFARLQIPVLRVALAEPEFFSALQHPARRLIDRMGSCVMGFEAGVTSAALEAEIKRVVQVIEQYPETGRRVFQLVFDEFQKFLATHLTGEGSASKAVSVAQQVEQKETLSVQYTIELRKLLNDVPVRSEVRDFLFKVWVDVLAVASVKHGLKSEQTAALKQVASDLLWAASAKPNRNDRARVIQQLPGILQQLRQGMTLLGFPQRLQDEHIKSISDTLADAFMSRTDVIPQEALDRLAHRLANLEDYLPESGVGDLDLDAQSLEMITGVDASNIEVISEGGSQPGEAMKQWAAELQIGTWFGLERAGKVNSVQLVWRSERGQLYMFVTGSGRCYLFQTQRLAAYLQAGLLVPSEDEALTVRATRQAIQQLEARPERLLA